MDVNAILDESLKTFSRPAASKAAQLILMLSLIDRTVLPRQITFTNGRSRLVIAVIDRKAQIADGAAASAVELVARMAGFCMNANALRHDVRAAKVPPDGGFTIAELVNAQAGASSAMHSGASAEAEGFTFDERGWPLRMPDDTGAKSLVSAWLVYLWMQNWQKRHEEVLGDAVLMTTTAGTRSRELAFRFSPHATDIMTFGPSELGRLLAAWRMPSTMQPQVEQHESASEG